MTLSKEHSDLLKRMKRSPLTLSGQEDDKERLCLLQLYAAHLVTLRASRGQSDGMAAHLRLGGEAEGHKKPRRQAAEAGPFPHEPAERLPHGSTGSRERHRCISDNHRWTVDEGFSSVYAVQGS